MMTSHWPAAAAAASLRACEGDAERPVRFDSASLALPPLGDYTVLGSIIPTAADPDQSCLARLSRRAVPALCNGTPILDFVVPWSFDSARSLHIRLS